MLRVMRSASSPVRSLWQLAGLSAAVVLIALWRVAVVFEMPAWQAAVPVAIMGVFIVPAAISFWRHRDEPGNTEMGGEL